MRVHILGGGRRSGIVSRGSNAFGPVHMMPRCFGSFNSWVDFMLNWKYLRRMSRLVLRSIMYIQTI